VDERLIRRRLAEERERYASIARGLKEGIDEAMTEAAGELSSYDQHAADLGSEMFERERDVGLRASALSTLERIDRAFARLESGGYGTCEACGRPIDAARLEAIPYAEECVDCAGRREEVESHRPVEEDVVSFARTVGDGGREAAYGADVAMESLARHGTANSPQDVPGAVDYGDVSEVDFDFELHSDLDPDLRLGPGEDLQFELERVVDELDEEEAEKREKERDTWE